MAAPIVEGLGRILAGEHLLVGAENLLLPDMEHGAVLSGKGSRLVLAQGAAAHRNRHWPPAARRKLGKGFDYFSGKVHRNRSRLDQGRQPAGNRLQIVKGFDVQFGEKLVNSLSQAVFRQKMVECIHGNGKTIGYWQMQPGGQLGQRPGLVANLNGIRGNGVQGQEIGRGDAGRGWSEKSFYLGIKALKGNAQALMGAGSQTTERFDHLPHNPGQLVVAPNKPKELFMALAVINSLKFSQQFVGCPVVAQHFPEGFIFPQRRPFWRRKPRLPTPEQGAQKHDGPVPLGCGQRQTLRKTKKRLSPRYAIQ